ncbi:unnamed protein product, partial [Brassica oleracea]
LQFLGLAAASGLKFPVEYGIVLEQQLKKEEDELRKNKRETSISSRFSFCLHRDRNPDSGIPGDLKSDSDSSPDRDSRYGNYPPEATCGYSCKHKKTLEEDPSAFAFDEVYDDMKHRDIVPKLQDRQDLKLTCVAGSGKGVSDTPVTLHIANAELAPTHPICLGLALN